MLNFILDLLFPISCLGCGLKGKDFICPSCFDKILLNPNPYTKLKKSRLDKLIITASYDNPLIKQAIYRYKYDFVRELSAPLSRLMIKKINSLSFFDEDFILMPVPLHQRRLRWRGFNQAELLAWQISRKLNLPLNSQMLIRSRATLPQIKTKNIRQRQNNLKGAFSLNVIPRFNRRIYGQNHLNVIPRFNRGIYGQNQNINPTNKNIILIDDICTSGTTLEECAKVLKPLRPKSIWGLVLARGN